MSDAGASVRLERKDLEACRSLLRLGSKSFWAASLTLPPRVREPATVVYAMCRVLDDAVDREGAGPEVIVALRARLERAYAGRPDPDAIDRAFSAVVLAHELPKAIFDHLLEGFAWDLEGRRYQTLESLMDYCVRVAGTVGVCMAALMGRRRHLVLERACDLGIAMQLTNVARDVGEDARNGRVYLPIEWLEEAGVDVDSWLAHPTASPAVRTVVQRLLQMADAYYLRADPGIAALPFDCRPAIRAARYIYAAIGHAIEQNELDSVSRRAVVSPQRKLRLLVRALRPSRAEQRSLFQTPFPGAQPLVEAVAR